MSATGTQTVSEVRRILTDQDTGKPVVLDDQIKQAIDRCVPLAASAMALGNLKVPDFLTLAVGTASYTIASTANYDMIGELRLKSDNVPLARQSREYVESLRQGTTLGTGRPECYYLEPQDDGTTVAVFWPTPALAENVTAWVQMEPQAWGSAEGATTSTIPFSQGGLRGLELMVAADLLEALDGDKAKALRLDKASIKTWRAEAVALFHAEKIRVIRFKRAEGPNSPRWLDAWAGVYIGPWRYR